MAWLLHRRTITRPTTFFIAALLVGPLTPALIIGALATLSRSASLPGHLAMILVFAMGGYIVGGIPALVAAMLILLRSPASVAEALVITFASSLVLGLLFTAVTGTRLNFGQAAAVSLGIASLSIPGAISAGLVAAWSGCFAPQGVPALASGAD